MVANPKGQEQDWDKLMQKEALTREDIYRQRVFGNNSGANQFVEVEERRKFKPYHLYAYIIFVIATHQWTFDRVQIKKEYEVYDAIRRPFDTTVFHSDPQPRRWNDIQCMEDVKEWLLVAFPDIMAPDVQHFNIPLGSIRFTMRRMQLNFNNDSRFNKFYDKIWKNPLGISAESQSASDDDQQPFGSYRAWSDVSLDWRFKAREDKRCPSSATWIDTQTFPDNMKYDVVEKHCRQWCETLIRPLTCHCFEQSKATMTCVFYKVPESAFELAEASSQFPEELVDDSEKLSVIIPTLESAPDLGLSAIYPMMRKFMFQDDKKGYKQTPGFVQHLSYYDQHDLIKIAAETGSTPPETAVVMSSEIEDWIAGGFLAKTSITVAVDFATYNPNYKMFSWVQLQFHSTAAGYVDKKLKIYSLIIDKEKDLSTWGFGEEVDSIFELIYIALLVLYIGRELYEVMNKSCGKKYFLSMWNWLSIGHLFINALTVLLWIMYKGENTFISELNTMQSATDPVFTTDNLTSFGLQVSAYRMFRTCAAFNFLFCAFQFLQYLNDIYPRVHVLVETVTSAFVPIFFFTVTCSAVLFGAIMWTYIGFGRKIVNFNSFTDAVVTVVAMTVGEFSSFVDVRNELGVESYLFYIPYQLFMIIVILNFPRAVLNAGYADATEKFEEEQKAAQLRPAAKTETSESGKRLRSMIYCMKKCWPEELNAKNMMEGATNKTTKVENKKSSFAIYILFTFLYTVMVVLITRTGYASQLTQTVIANFKMPTFSKTIGITGQSIHGASFSDIETRADVQTYIREVLPAALYKRDSGTFDGQPNPLKTYSSSPQYKQLVMANWNILVGQKPARITVKLSKMKPIGTDAMKGVLHEVYEIRETLGGEGDQAQVSGAGLPDGQFVPEEDHSGAMSDASKSILQTYCNYSFGHGEPDATYATSNGFVCMLSVDEQTTRKVLNAMSAGFHGLLTAQTMTFTVEFVIYNAWAQTFMYCELRFGFQPSGLITKKIQVEPVSLELTTGTTGMVLQALLIMVLVLNILFLGQNIFELVRAMKNVVVPKGKDGKALNGKRCPLMFREFLYFYILEPFNLLDLMSCLATIVVLFMFFSYTSAVLNSYYFFQEEPVWIKGKCASNNFAWCDDSEVITQFFIAKDSFKTFVRACSVNTVAIFMRMLRHLKSFEHMRVIFSTIAHGFADIAWFVVIFFVCLLGYVFMGHIVFGSNFINFSDEWNSLVGCFEIFLGQFDSRAMAAASLPVMLIYVLTYWFVFKLIIINMFLAIIDRNYNILDKKRIVEKEAEDLRKLKDNHEKAPSWAAAHMAGIKALFKPQPHGDDGPATAAVTEEPVTPAKAEANADQALDEEPEMKGALQMASFGAELLEGAAKEIDRGAAAKDEDADVQAEEVHAECLKEKVSNKKWTSLPEEVQAWSLKKATEINKFIINLEGTRPKAGKDDNPDKQAQTGNAEDWGTVIATSIEKRKEEYEAEAMGEKHLLDTLELKHLRKVHMDHESLSWYIIKRDAELKKLEAAKKKKQDRFDKMVDAAKSLIKPEEDEGGEYAQPSISNR